MSRFQPSIDFFKNQSAPVAPRAFDCPTAPTPWPPLQKVAARISVPGRAHELPSWSLLLGDMQTRPADQWHPTTILLRFGALKSTFHAVMNASGNPTAVQLPLLYQPTPPASPSLSLLRMGDLSGAMEHLNLAPARRVPALQAEVQAIVRSQGQRSPTSVFSPKQLQPAQLNASSSSALLQAL